MKILTAEQVRAWDQYTIKHEPIASIDLMERAASQCIEWLMERYDRDKSFHIFCGKGNNGGDGLAIARLLMLQGYSVVVSILEFGHKGTEDFQTNLARLHQQAAVDIRFIQGKEQIHPIEKDTIIIDALFGSGLNRGIEGVTAALVEHLNSSGATIISIDMPSGLFAERSSKGNNVIIASYTLTFQCYKPAFFFAENDQYLGQIHLLNIGLHPKFYQEISTAFELLDIDIIRSIHKPRNRYAHKGNFGHALLVAGSYGKLGAAILSGRATLRSGAGLLTIHLPGCGYEVAQGSLPEAMVQTDFNSSFITKVEDDLSKYDAIGIGPGLGTASETKMMLRELLDAYRSPVVLDADALNIMSTQKDLLGLVPLGSILTPHPKEFARLFGETTNDFDRISLALQKAHEHQCVIILKGHHSFIAVPGNRGFFNSTGNAGMATAGSGDVLTGILTGLLAQGYSSTETAILGVYIHGLAGDLSLNKQSMESIIAGDIVENIGAAFIALKPVR